MTLATMRRGHTEEGREIIGVRITRRCECECETEETTYAALEHEILFESANTEAIRCGPS